MYAYSYENRLSSPAYDVLFNSTPIKTYSGAGHYFGVSIKVIDNRLIIGAPGYGSNTPNRGKGLIMVVEPQTKYNWSNNYTTYTLDYDNSVAGAGGSNIGSTISAHSNFIFSTDYANEKIIVWKYEDGTPPDYNFKE